MRYLKITIRVGGTCEGGVLRAMSLESDISIQGTVKNNRGWWLYFTSRHQHIIMTSHPGLLILD
jgi:hypothetical protein